MEPNPFAPRVASLSSPSTTSAARKGCSNNCAILSPLWMRIWLVAQVLDEHDDFAAVAGIDYAGIAHQALAGKTGVRFHNAARSGHELNGDAGVDVRTPCAAMVTSSQA